MTYIQDVYKQALQSQIKLTLETGNKATDELMNNIIQSLNNFIIELAKQQIRIAFDQAEKEVKDLQQRTREGILTAKLKGKQIGQAKGSTLVTTKSKKAKEIILEHSKDFNGNLSDIDCIKLTSVSRNSYYKYKRELKEVV